MYVPQQFRLKDRAAAIELIRSHSFATVLSIVDGATLISYLPAIVVSEEPELTIAVHFARANAHWQHVESAGATLLFHGPHGYISPRWYVDPPANVPTWNYAVVHATATARIVGAAETHEIVQHLAIEHENGAPNAWSIETADPAYIASQSKGIVGVHFTVTALEAKFKLSQNRSAADRAGAVAGLRATGRAGDAALADEMERA